MNDKKITLKYFLVVLVAAIFTWILHEFAHWFTAKLLGYITIMRLNGTSYIDGENPSDWHRVYVSAAGPIITIIQGLIAFFYLKLRSWNTFVYALLFIAFYMRLLAGLMNFNMLNDEGRISEFLGIGTFTLSIIIIVFLFYILFKISKNHQLNSKFLLATTLFVMGASTIIILSDMFFGIRII